MCECECGHSGDTKKKRPRKTLPPTPKFQVAAAVVVVVCLLNESSKSKF